MDMDFDAECSCGDCSRIENDARVIVTADPVRGEVCRIVGFSEERSAEYGIATYLVYVPAVGRVVPILGSVIFRSPFQNEELEDAGGGGS